jgi:hypothetical protein
VSPAPYLKPAACSLKPAVPPSPRASFEPSQYRGFSDCAPRNKLRTGRGLYKKIARTWWRTDKNTEKSNSCVDARHDFSYIRFSNPDLIRCLVCVCPGFIISILVWKL